MSTWKKIKSVCSNNKAKTKAVCLRRQFSCGLALSVPYFCWCLSGPVGLEFELYRICMSIFICLFCIYRNVAQIKTATSSCSALVNLSVLVMAMKASVADPAMARLLVQLHDSLESFKGRRINQLDFIRDVESFVYDRLCLSCWIGMMPKIVKFASEKDYKNLKCVSKDCRCEHD